MHTTRNEAAAQVHALEWEWNLHPFGPQDDALPLSHRSQGCKLASYLLLLYYTFLKRFEVAYNVNLYVHGTFQFKNKY